MSVTVCSRCGQDLSRTTNAHGPDCLAHGWTGMGRARVCCRCHDMMSRVNPVVRIASYLAGELGTT